MSEAEENTEQNTEQNEEVTVDPTEAAARETGWVNKEEWVEKGNDPAEHRSAELYNERGMWIEKQKKQDKRISEMERNFDTRMSNANQLHNAQLETQRQELIRKRAEFVEDANVAGVDSTQAQIDALQPLPVAQPQKAQAFVDWEGENPWIMGNSPKAVYAKAQVAHYQNIGSTPENALSMMETDMSREFPDIPQAPLAPMAEGGSKPGKKASKTLTMQDLTADEKKMRTMVDWGSEKEFLQAVKDVRAEA